MRNLFVQRATFIKYLVHVLSLKKCHFGPRNFKSFSLIIKKKCIISKVVTK